MAGKNLEIHLFSGSGITHRFPLPLPRLFSLEFSSAAIGIPIGRITPIAPITPIDMPMAADPQSLG
jgi:hypothetical protein